MNQTLKSENIWTGLARQLTRCQPISCSVCPNLLLVGELLVLLGQDLGQVQVAHLRVDFGVFGSFLHEEAEVRSQRLLGEIWMSLNMREVESGQRNTWIHSVTTTTAVIPGPGPGPGSSSHLQFFAFVRILHKLNGVYDELRHRPVLTDLRHKNTTASCDQ